MALAIDPVDPATLYAGTSGGGVFRSTNGGGSWIAINAGMTSTNVLALAIDPAIPTTLFAGTSGGGVFKSIDGGDSWTPVNSGLPSSQVRALAIGPSAIYAGTPDGVFESNDGGGTWTAMSTGLTDPDVRAIAVDPLVPSFSYAGTSGGVFRSSGASWTRIGTGLDDVLALAIDRGGAWDGGHALRGYTRPASSTPSNGVGWTAINAGLSDTLVQALAIDLSPTRPVQGRTLRTPEPPAVSSSSPSMTGLPGRPSTAAYPASRSGPWRLIQRTRPRSMPVRRAPAFSREPMAPRARPGFFRRASMRPAETARSTRRTLPSPTLAPRRPPSRCSSSATTGTARAAPSRPSPSSPGSPSSTPTSSTRSSMWPQTSAPSASRRTQLFSTSSP